MYFHKRYAFSQRVLILILISHLSPFSQNGCQAAAPLEKKQATAPLSPTTMERIMKDFRALPQHQVTRNRARAGQKLQANIAKALTVLSRNEKEVPAHVRGSAKAILRSMRAGKLTTPISNAVPNLISNFPINHELTSNPSGQLDNVLQNVRPNSPNAIRSPIDGVVNFLKANVNGVNRMLYRVLAPTPNLVDGVVRILLGGVDAVTEGVSGSLNSLGPALGGALGGAGGSPLSGVLG